jgi:hypothetical protein
MLKVLKRAGDALNHFSSNQKTGEAMTTTDAKARRKAALDTPTDLKSNAVRIFPVRSTSCLRTCLRSI